MKTLATILLTAAFAAATTWFVMRPRRAEPAPQPAVTGQQPALYQCPMHPQVTSNRPGRCTICGMELVLSTPGIAGRSETAGKNLVVLTQNQVQVLHVQTATAKVRPLARTLRVTGNIENNYSSYRILSAYVDGRIDRLYVNYVGAEVTAAQPLADLYSPSLLQAEREYRQLGGQLRDNTALRLRQMGLTPQQITALDHKPADALSSQILAPISGTVVSQSVFAGQYVTTGQSLFEIADYSTMWFMFRTYEPDLPWLKLGLNVSVTSPAKPGKLYQGKITFIEPSIDAATRTANVRVELPNLLVDGHRELQNRLYADGLVELAAPAVLSVPRTAVIATGPQAVVYIERGDGGYEHRKVTLGRHGDTHLEILAGLSDGDEVVTNGNLLIDGQAEIHRAFASQPEDGAVPPAAGLNEEQQQALAKLVQIADAMAAALGDDNLIAFNQASEPAMAATAAVVQQLRPLVATGGRLDALDAARHFHGFKDLASARAAFHKFSVAATAVLEHLRQPAGMPDFQLYECPMVNDAIPGVVPKARWLQTGGRKMRNPFFGSDMPDCGKEIPR